MKVVAVCGEKGGVGKTITTLSLATEFSFLSDRKKKILIVDSDPSENATTWCTDQKTTGTICDIYEDRKFNPINALYQCTKEFPGIDIMACDDRLYSFDTLVGNRSNTSSILKRALKKLDYDIVFIDTHPMKEGGLISNVLISCDAFIVPLDHERNALNGILGIMKKVRDLHQDDCFEKLPVNLGGVFVKVEERATATKEIDQEVTKAGLSKYISPIRVPKSVHVKNVVNKRTTLQFNREHPVCNAYSNLAKYVANKIKFKF